MGYSQPTLFFLGVGVPTRSRRNEALLHITYRVMDRLICWLAGEVAEVAYVGTYIHTHCSIPVPCKPICIPKEYQ
jgi:hypothetical protein